MFGLMELMARAAADAALAEGLYRDPHFRADLREGKDVRRTFSVTTLSSGRRIRREIPAWWRLRVDAARARPLL